MKTATFITAFVLFFTAMNTYVAYRAEVLYGIYFSFSIIILTFVTVMVPTIKILDDYFNIKPLYIFFYMLYGAHIISTSFFLIEHIISFILGVNMPFIPLLALFAIIFSIYRAYHLKIKQFNIHLGTKLRMIHLSDLHLGAVYQERFLDMVVKKVNSLKPDIVVITGDIFDGSGTPSLKMVAPLKDIKVPIYAVFGNHDYYVGLDKMQALLEKVNVKVLRNDVIEFKGIQFIGMDCPKTASWKTPNQMLEKLELSDKPKILLHHMPSGIKQALHKKIDLFLAGHTHGGQIFPFTLFVKKVFKYKKGLYNIKHMKLYVSEGTGTWGPPMRWLSNSEIAVWDVK